METKPWNRLIEVGAVVLVIKFNHETGVITIAWLLVIILICVLNS